MAIKRGIVVVLGLLLQILFFLFLYIDLAELILALYFNEFTLMLLRL